MRYKREIDIERGDIFWVSASENAYDRGSVKTRPAIIVSNDFNNKHSNSLEVVFLTTAPKTELPTHCTIRSSKEISTALCEQISTIKRDQVEGYIGKCTPGEMAMVDICALISLGIEQRETPPHLGECNNDSYDEIKKEAEMYKNLYNNLLEKILAK